MNNTQLDPGLSAMLAGTNLSIDPGALLQHQHQHQQPPLFEGDTSSSRTTSTSSVPRMSTPDTDIDDDDDDFDEDQDDDTPQKPQTRSKSKMPAASSRSRTANTTTTTSPTKSKRGSAAAAAVGAADKRRKRNLERNRAAASKCRQRKKQWQDGLERKKMELESRYKALHSESKELIEEVAQLKNFVMAHAACNDANIDDWIRNEADSFVRRMSAAQMHHAAVSAGAPAVSMAQLQSPAQSALTATPPMNDTLSNLFAPTGSKAPFDTDATGGGMRPGVADTIDQAGNSSIFNQDMLMANSMQA